MRPNKRSSKGSVRKNQLSLAVSSLVLLLACVPFGTSSQTTLTPTSTPIPTWTLMPTSTFTPEPTTGSISGKVIDSVDASPISFAGISTAPPTGAVTADEYGVYFISEVPPGIYTVTAVKPGYIDASVQIAVMAGRTTIADLHMVAISAHTSPTPIARPFTTNGLVAYYPFCGNANDASGNDNHGTVYGAILTEDAHGTSQSAYYFNGADSFIRIPHNEAIDGLGSEMSVVAWIKVDVDTEYDIYDYRHIISKGATFGDLWADYAMGLSNPEGALHWEYSSSANSPIRLNTNDPLPQGSWHQVAVTFEYGRIRFFVDGSLQGTMSGSYETLRSSPQPLYIGCRYESPIIGVFRGAIDDVRIYNRTLDESEIQALYVEYVEGR